tara:strand:+ start:352 stop:555 length:204 start_codon:yes stop_codon:yes gene_type:complete
MAFEVKDNTFSIFENQNKTNERQPDFTGKGKFNGTEIKVAGWKKTGKSGTDFVSFKIEKEGDYVAKG